MNTNQTLGDMLKNLQTEKGRAAIVAAMITKTAIPQEIIERTYDFYMQTKEYERAYSLAQKAGMRQKVRDLERMASSYEEREEDEELATEEQEEQARRIISSYERAGEYAPVELGVKTIDALLVLGREDDAAAVAAYYGVYSKAIELKEKAKKWKDAAQIAEQNAWYERAAENYEKAKEFGKAADNLTAEVAARKEKRKKSQNFIVAFLSKWTGVYTNQEQDLLVRAAENYIHAGWNESAEKTLKKVADKRKVYAFFEAQGAGD